MSGFTNPKFLGGIAVGVLAPNVIPYQDQLITLAAVLPMPKAGMGGLLRGYVVGRIGRGFVPSLGALSSGVSSGGSDGINYG